jgi:hypothetical protein
MIKARCFNQNELHKIDLMIDQWNNFLTARRSGIFEFATATNWLTMNEREYMLSECLKLLNKVV